MRNDGLGSEQKISRVHRIKEDITDIPILIQSFI
jgi:hypothetical protein